MGIKSAVAVVLQNSLKVAMVLATEPIVFSETSCERSERVVFSNSVPQKRVSHVYRAIFFGIPALDLFAELKNAIYHCSIVYLH